MFKPSIGGSPGGISDQPEPAQALRYLRTVSIVLSVRADNAAYGERMIDLTRLNGHRMVVNCDLIKFAEATPDTTLSLVSGDKLIVLESCDELIQRILLYRARVLAQAWPEAASAISATRALAASSDEQPSAIDDREA